MGYIGFPSRDPVLIRVAQSGELLADRARVARSAIQRAVGLLNRAVLNPGEGLILPRCSSVHMFFMRFPIDVVFCAGDGKVITTQSDLQPWRLSRYVWSAAFVIELPTGTLQRLPDLTGRQLRFDAIPS